ncbi:hypothetical protein [Streptomyces sp. NA02950]|uniref:SCO3933 family regulatory protein n=1 Tax=Streptomyces sp. NA02950 TaxID=2742137 RepID=UPI0020CAB895|nr:hypothetical protein [Streptomyces sp. NA02950]
MQTFPVDVARLGTLMCVVPPEPRVDPTTGQVRTDREGRRLNVVGVSVRQSEGRRADVIEVAVPGEAPAVAEGMRISIDGLVAVSWSMGDRHGISFRATAITPANGGKSTPGGPSSAGAVTGKAKAAGGDAA